MPTGADFQPNAECDTFSVVIQRTRDLDAACPGAPARCTVACGAALFPFLDECGSFVNALSVFDAADGVRDDQAGTFVELREACDGIPSIQIIGELQPLWSAGQCPDEWMEGVSATGVPESTCEDTLPSCAAGISAGFYNCAIMLCPTCAMAHQCDKTCSFCGDGQVGHRLMQIATAGHECPPTTFETEAAGVNDACCDQGGCTGVPTECDARCGVVYVDFFSRCSALLGVYHPEAMVEYTRLEHTCAQQMPAEPLLRLLGRCTSHDTTVASCQAKLAQGITSCFIYLQQDALALGAMAVYAGQTIETHGLRDIVLQVQADWEIGASASLLLADLRLVGGSGGVAQFNVQGDGALTLQHAQLEGGAITSAGFVALLDSLLTNAQMTHTASTATLTLSGGTATSSAVNLAFGTAIASSCELVDSPLVVSGMQELGSSLSLSECQLQSDGSSVPLTVQAGGFATVRASEFQSTGGDDITAVSVDEGGTVTVGESQLVHANGRADPFPCNGTLPTCASVHTGPVEMIGPALVTLAAPLVCDVMTGECLSDLCATMNCGEHGTCQDGICTCHSPYTGERCDQLPCCSSEDKP